MSKPPPIHGRFLCLVSRDEKILAASIAAALHVPGHYLPMLEVPNVENSESTDKDDPMNDNYIMANRAHEFDVKSFNVLARMPACEYVILAGLTDQQKKFLTYTGKYNVLEINSLSDVRDYLHSLSDKKESIRCQSKDIGYGLYQANNKNKFLTVDESAGRLKHTVDYGCEGLVVIEENEHVNFVVAISYATAIQAAVHIVSAPDTDLFEIRDLIQDWKSNKNNAAYRELEAKLYAKIEGIDFKRFAYASFFTVCSPYSLILQNIIPFTYVHQWFRPDFFIFNSIYTYSRPLLYSAVVFSPLEFGANEETGFVVKQFVDKDFAVKKLIGKAATVYKIEKHVREYPYQVLHICSHGGEVSGYPVVLNFTDKRGDSHTVEYDDVVSFAPTKSEELIEVTHKYIFRKFDGLGWRSRAFKEKHYPHDVFTTMMATIRATKPKYGKRIEAVEGSCAIKCVDFVYQAMFNDIAGHKTQPFIFNNTCWSWIGIPDNFLFTGCTGYIGTLWEVQNTVAVSIAEAFYPAAFDKSIAQSLHDAMQHIRGTNSEDIYIYWGLHFAKFEKGGLIDVTKRKIAMNLLDSLYHWKDQMERVTDEKDKDMFRRLYNWNYEQLFNHFFKEVITIIKPFTK